MPYRVTKGSGARPWKVVKADTGEVVGSSTSKAQAQAAMRARYAHSKDTGSGKSKRR